MGYSTPSADEVYKYAFRLDRHENELSDGFGWTILFLNDSSQASRKFLATYGAELCLRTADRIRFVFFSNNLTSGPSGPSTGSVLLRAILAASTFPKWRRFDFETPPWDEVRPRHLRPLRTPEEIDAQIGWEVRTYSVVPGSQETFRMAHRLGLARFIPCFLLFSDVGELVVRLLPLDESHPESSYKRICSWIDAFYESNSEALACWKKVEDEIAEYCRISQATLTSVRAWVVPRTTQWKSLRSVSRCLIAVQSFDNHVSDALRIAAQDSRNSFEVRRQLTALKRSFDEVEAQRRFTASAQSLAETLHRPLAPDDLVAFLDSCTEGNNPVVQQLAHVVRKSPSCRTLLSAPPDHPNPTNELAAWWQSPMGRPLSRRRYEQSRQGWRAYSELLYTPEERGDYRKIKRLEFSVCTEAACAAKFLADPEISASDVMACLASYFDVPADDALWCQATATYKNHLESYFRDLIGSAPLWLKSVAGMHNLTVGECLPTAGQRHQDHRSRSLLARLPRLAAAVNSVETDRDEILVRANQLRHEAAADVQGLFRQSFLRQANRAARLAGDKESIRGAIAAVLAGRHSEIFLQVLANAERADSEGFPRPPGKVVVDASHLIELLDRYETAVMRVKFPFDADPQVLRVRIPLTLAATVSEEPQSISDRSVSARRKIENATISAATAVAEWPSARSYAKKLMPLDFMADSIVRSLSAERLSELHRDSGTGTVLDMLTEGGTTRVLDKLNVDELLAVERYTQYDQPILENSLATKEEICDSIIANCGLLAGPVKPKSSGEWLSESRMGARPELARKILQEEFDVFLAHNSLDRSSVLELGRTLRRRDIYPWIDVEQIPPGSWFQDVIQEATRRVKSVAVVLGANGLGKWQLLELKVSIARCIDDGIPVIPVLLPGVKALPRELSFLHELTTVTFENDLEDNDALKRLVWGITGAKPALRH